MSDTTEKKEKPKESVSPKADKASGKKQKRTDTRTIPVIITLSAALISCALSILQEVEFSVFVARLLLVVVIFGMIGIIIRVILDRCFFNPKAEDEEKPEEGEEDKESEPSGEDTEDESQEEAEEN